jgi:hypothetical protein
MKNGREVNGQQFNAVSEIAGQYRSKWPAHAWVRNRGELSDVRPPADWYAGIRRPHQLGLNLLSLLTRDCQIGGTRAQRDGARKANPITIAKKERAIHLDKEVSKKRKVVNAALQIFNGLKFRVLD